VARLLEAGAILFARTTLPEFGEAGNCYTPLWGVTRNPWNLHYGPGGSSSGAGAALAAGMATIADGSDIGGSIRIPAACCNVVGYKPPYGRNPNARIASFDPYQHYGPLARTVGDIALMQNVISGFHLEDIGALRERLVVPTNLEPVRDWKIALSMDLGYFQVDPDVRRNTEAVATALRDAGNFVQSVDLGWTEESFDAWLAVNATRGAAVRKVGDFERWRPHLADYTVDMIEHGKKVTAEQLVRALEIHVEMYAKLGPLLEEYRVLICPTNAIPSVPADRSPLDLNFEIDGEPARPKIAAAWFMTYPFNMLSQLPVMSVPSGFASSGVPTGVQIVARSWDDLAVFRVAATIERIRPWAQFRPRLPTQ
jgi:amidase